MLTDSMAQLCLWTQKLYETNKETLGLEDVFYGDQERIPRVPALCVETGEKNRELNGAPRRTLVTLTFYLIVYHELVGNENVTRDTREKVDKLAESIETLFHQDGQMKDSVKDPDFPDQVIDSMVVLMEHGYQQKKNSLYRATRLTIQATSQVQLPYA